MRLCCIQFSHTHSAYTSFLRKWYASGIMCIHERWNQKLQPDSHMIASSLSPCTSRWHTPHGYIGGAFGFCGLNIIGVLGGYILEAPFKWCGGMWFGGGAMLLFGGGGGVGWWPGWCGWWSGWNGGPPCMWAGWLGWWGWWGGGGGGCDCWGGRPCGDAMPGFGLLLGWAGWPGCIKWGGSLLLFIMPSGGIGCPTGPLFCCCCCCCCIICWWESIPGCDGGRWWWGSGGWLLFKWWPNTFLNKIIKSFSFEI